MSLDQQIRIYEDRINQLEQMKRTVILQSSDNADLSRINVDLDENYQHMAILKIRKMMGF